MDGSSDHLIAAQVAAFLKKERFKSVVVACSGGPDSVALALAVSEASAKSPLRISLGHVNHHLRGRASDADERFVRKLGKSLGMPVRVFSRPVASGSGNLEEKARESRYAALCRYARRSSADAVLTAAGTRAGPPLTRC
jgi:tRNA(Ile)-lysidine synthase